MATTPPMRTVIHTPQSPLQGPKYDSYLPYSTRKSTRQSSQRAVRTPPPQASHLSPHSESQSRPSKGSRTRSAVHTYSPPSSTQTSPQKKLFNTGNPKSRGSGAMSGSSLDSDPFQDMEASSSHHGVSTMGSHMLPTPAKTPRRNQVQHENVMGRVLFPVRPDTVEEAMPTPRKNKRNRRHVGFSLDSDVESEGGIPIFTDSQDKIPELDLSEDNPFIEHPVKQDAPKKPSEPKVTRKRKAGSESITEETIKEEFDHERGMIYVFRGRKLYKKFPHDSPPAEDDLTTSTIHFTRSSVKPRLLFPSAQQQRERQLADEEATTDIEASHDSDITDIASEGSNIEEQEGAQVVTPVKTTFQPATPPTTVHATRAATKKAVEASPLVVEPVSGAAAVKKGGKRSPFDGWARRKAGASGTGAASAASAAAGKGRKRQGEVLEKGDESDGGVPVNGAGHKKVKGAAAGS